MTLGLPPEVRHIADMLMRTTTLELVSQIGFIAAAAVCAFAVRRAAKRLIARGSAYTFEEVRRWPLGLALFALLVWIGHSLFLQGGQNSEVLRLAAIAATAWAGASLALRAVGRTTLGWSAVALISLVASLEALGLAASVIDALDSTGLSLGETSLTPWFAIKAVIVVGGLLWAAQHTGDLIDRALTREQIISRSGQVLFAKLARMGLLTLAVILSLGFLGVDFTTLAVLSGAIGLGLGFGLQKVVSNYVAGLILLTDRSIKPGDVIEVEFAGGQLRGEVTELAGRFTAITLRTGVETLIPNEILISSPVSNWSHTSREVQVRIPVGVSYNTDVEKAQELCIEAALATGRVLKTPSPVCLVTGFGESSVDLDVRFGSTTRRWAFVTYQARSILRFGSV
ncbi:MAG: mechanosensitive ion channel, partial [Rhodospirillales bacterium]|nr:mechanosensitive ion channel [Rhodospirillales bacterium]